MSEPDLPSNRAPDWCLRYAVCVVPVDFVVPGTPKSLQASNSGKRAWKARVRGYVPARAIPTAAAVQLRLYFFFNGTTGLDVDNIIKPISDALNGLVYNDDSQVTDVASLKRDLQDLPVILNPPPTLVTAIAIGGDFVYVRVDPAPKTLRFNI